MHDLLVRDFNDSDTDSISDATWHAYCCAVEPNEANQVGGGRPCVLLANPVVGVPTAWWHMEGGTSSSRLSQILPRSTARLIQAQVRVAARRAITHGSMGMGGIDNRIHPHT